MPSPPIPSVRARRIWFAWICIALLACLLWQGRRQVAESSRGNSSVQVAPVMIPEKGLSPEGNTITVNSLSDVANSSDGLCTLREAIAAANNNFASGATPGECVAGSNVGTPDVINITVTGTINLTGPLPIISTEMAINGPGSGLLTVRRDTGGDYRIFFTDNRNVNFSGMTIANGKTPDGASGVVGQGSASGGGMLLSGGIINLTDLVVTGNRTGNGGNTTGGSGTGGGHSGDGGGISASSVTLTMTNCVVSNNLTGDGGIGSSSGGSGVGGGILMSGTSTLTNVTVTGNRTGNGGEGISAGLSGADSGRGGGIFSSGNAVMNNVNISNNVVGDAVRGSAGRGGGLFIIDGTVTLVRGTISNNVSGSTSGLFSSAGGGGGISTLGTLTVIDSVINGNSSGSSSGPSGSGGLGGGIEHLNISGNSLTVINSTISGNSAGGPTGKGGGIQGPGTLRLINCTITGNSAVSNEGHGVSGGTSNLFVRNTIVAGNGVGGTEITGTYTSQGHNLIGRSNGTNGFTNGVNGDQVGSLASPLNALLGPLSNNGGLTLTHALLAGSPASDAGDNCVNEVAHCGDANLPQLTNDQRRSGFSRLVDGPDLDATATVDIGAYEAQPPLSNLPDTSTNEDTQLLVVFDGGDTSTITSVTATSSNPTLVPNDSAHLSVAISGANGIITITPAADLSGTTNITVTVNRTGGSEDKTFMLTVNSVNDAPSFTKGADQTVNEDSGSQTVNNWATNISPGPVDEAAQTVTFQITGNTNAALFSSSPAMSPSGVLTYTPAANANGSATITITLMDNGGTANGGSNTSASQTFVITVNAVNDAPSFVKGTDRTVNEDSGFQSVSPWATSISAGATNESSQSLSFQVTNNTNPTLFSTAPAVSSSGQLTFSPASNQFGSATITIVLKDNGGTANGAVDTSASQTFTITVNSVNDSPSFSRGANPVVLEDAGAQTLNNYAVSISPGPANESGQTVNFTVTNISNPALFSVAPAVSSTGTLTYTPAANANGAATITLALKDDGGTANGGSDTSSQNFGITVTAVNDAPSFTPGPNQSVNEDAGPQSVPNWATGLSAGPANESAQTLTFTATNNNNALFSVQPAISATGTLTYTPAANLDGTATVSVTVKDNGGTTNGGVDTSAAQTLTISVNPVNDAPSFTKGPDQNVNNNAGMQTVNNWATNVFAGPGNESSQTVTFVITGNTNPGLFAVAPAINSTGTLTYQPATNAGGAATITVALQDNGGTANGGSDQSAGQSFSININPVGGAINFTTANLNSPEGSGFVNVTVKRTGDVSRPVMVDYATSADNGLPCSTANGVATPKCDFIAALGQLSFEPGEDTKTVTILINQDSFVEGPETFTLELSNQTDGSALGSPATVTITIVDDPTEPSTNAIDDAEAFVRQHYHDFLNREADPAGLAFWVDQINSCGSDAACTESRRVNVSAAFFLSIEFQQTGYLVERVYKTAFGDATGISASPSSHQLSVPIVRFDEFLEDTQRLGLGVVVLQPGWEQVLESNKQAYARDFVQTARFIAAFPTTMTPAEFVDKLFLNAGVTPTTAERNAAINEFGAATTSSNVAARGRALRDVAENGTLSNQEFNRAFVLMEYFGYLRRNPNDAPESTLDYTGYDFWLTKLNQFNGNYINAEMVKAFLSSTEYRQRFGP